MNEYNSDKKYESFKIPDRQQVQHDRTSLSVPQDKKDTSAELNDGLFYVIDYGSSNMKGVGKFVLKSQKIDPPKKDEIRDLFHSMRDIARASHPQYYANNRFFDKRVQQEDAKILYKQGMFMKDFTDDYSDNTQFSSYFPNYQLMNYEQLRTYFTWRTMVRKGNVTDTSLSYAYLYIYELLNNIGVGDPQDGLDKLMSFWNIFREYNKSIDKYVLRWLKDYYIYYELPQSFREFIEKNNLANHYPKMTDTDNNFDLFCSISKYDIRSSAFFTEDNIKLITDCFYFVVNQLKQVFKANGIQFEDAIFQPTKKMSVWQPFKGALFYQWMKQSDRRIVFSENEIYICNQNNWMTSSMITSESGRSLIGYILKQMESVLRIATKYKYKLSANIDMVTHAVVGQLRAAGLSLEKIVSNAVMEFYREATKTVVSVDHSALSRIRQEALAIQEKLIVPEHEESFIPTPASLTLSYPKPVNPSSQAPINPTSQTPINPTSQAPISPFSQALVTSSPEYHNPLFATSKDIRSMLEADVESTSQSDVWMNLKNALNHIELQALSALTLGETDIKKFADHNGIMLEVLIDGINVKAMDFVGDNLLDDEFTIYEDYIDQVKEMVE